jgi:hypothetical protein
VTYRVAENMTRMRIEINVVRPGTVWVDDVSVIAISE